MTQELTEIISGAEALK
ncbi:F0F1 ATP synthase subunit gamma [Anaerostipes hadrus]|nr:F0F1 ATP synthase subunit gamma [Anaerostipes hadrus]